MNDLKMEGARSKLASHGSQRKPKNALVALEII
jgi:hypothetical protein